MIHFCADEVNAMLASVPFIGVALVAVRMYGKYCVHGIKGFCKKCLTKFK